MGIKQKGKSLSSINHELANPTIQLEVLNNQINRENSFPQFHEKIKNIGFNCIVPTSIEIFQVNIGKLCNQTCAHCHVDAGPDKKRENMDRHTLKKCLDIIQSVETIHTIDITGGAPEMNPNFRWFVKECRKLGKKVIDRCNLTIINANKNYESLPGFFAENSIHLISSLPFYNKRRTDSQRGDGVFESSVNAIKKLNALGYGITGSGLILDLVYNPSGAFLPDRQDVLEPQFKQKLKDLYDVSFNKLLCITNMPISRFLDYLIQSGNYDDYMELLINAFNPTTLHGLMCRNTLSISWDGYIYDCDFNQMLDLKVSASSSQHISSFNLQELSQRNIVLNQHCFGCTAGAGSSCGGEIG